MNQFKCTGSQVWSDSDGRVKFGQIQMVEWSLVGIRW